MLVHGIALSEALCVHRNVSKLVKGNVPATVIEKMEPDLHFPALSKQTVIESGPAGLAKLLNDLEVPKAFKDYLLSVPALGFIVAHQIQQSANVNKIVAGLQPKKPEEKP